MAGPITQLGSIVFPIDIAALWRDRCLSVTEGMGNYRLPSGAIYCPARDFIARHASTGYQFKLVSALHAAGVKMMKAPTGTDIRTTLFATGGLYLALDPGHVSLGIRGTFGDFTAGFAHQFGVALAVMVMSEAYRIPWDQLSPIPVRGKKVLDYEAPIPGNQGWLRLEAKGVTSTESLRAARGGVSKKKVENRTPAGTPSTASQLPTAMIGVITRAARSASDHGMMEIMDPEFEYILEARQWPNQLAGRYLHYAKVAGFAGLERATSVLLSRAKKLLREQQRFRRRPVKFESDAMVNRFHHNLIGVRWRLGDTSNGQESVWFYQAMDTQRLRTILEENEFPATSPYDGAWQDDSSRLSHSLVESFLPDGSYFGIGIGDPIGFREIDPRQPDTPLALVQIG